MRASTDDVDELRRGIHHLRIQPYEPTSAEILGLLVLVANCLANLSAPAAPTDYPEGGDGT